MSRFDEINETLTLLGDRFEGMMRTDRDRDTWRDWLARIDASADVVARAIQALVADWKPNRNPTRPEIMRFVERAKIDEGSRGKIRECYAEAADVRSKIGDDYLAMSAMPADAVCVSCADDYVQRGIGLDHPMLRHVHYSLDDLDATPSLELAISAARSVMRHPLDAIATARTPEQLRALLGRIRSAFASLKIQRVDDKINAELQNELSSGR